MRYLLYNVLAVLWLTGCCPLSEVTRAEHPSSVDRNRLPTAPSARKWTPPGLETWKLKNGMDVWLLKQTHAPLAAVKLVLPNGAAIDPVGKAGLTDVTIDMLDEGAAGRSALEISVALQRLATTYGVRVGQDATTISMGLLATKLGPSLDILATFLRKPTFAVWEFKRRKALRLAAALASEAQPRVGQIRATLRVLFGDGYGGWTASGYASSLKGITLADVKEHYGKMVVPDGTTLVVVGSVSRRQLEVSVNRAFGGWTGKSTATPRRFAPPRHALGRLYVIDYPGTSQTALAVVRRSPGVTDPAYFSSALFNRVLGGAFVSRVNMNLREDKGYTYGARSRFVRWKKAGFFFLSTQVKRDTTKASLHEIDKELRGISGDRPIGQKEFESAKRGLLLGFPGKFEKIASVASQLADAAADGLGSSWPLRWFAGVQGTELKAALATASRTGALRNHHIIVAGDWTKLAADLKSFKLPIVMLDKEGKPLPVPKPEEKPVPTQP
jgi:zinc protease